MAKEKNEPPKFPQIGERLSHFVKHSGEPSARQFAIKAGITPAVLSNLMLGYSMPGGETLASIADAFRDFDATWLLTGNSSRPIGPPSIKTETATSAADTQSNEVATPQALVPTLTPTVRRKARRPIMAADPDLSHLTPEQRADYWKRRHDRLLAEQASEYESQIHQETLQLVSNGESFTKASPDAADLYAFADSLAIAYPCPSEERSSQVHAIPRFVPMPRVLPMYTKVGFQQQAAGR